MATRRPGAQELGAPGANLTGVHSVLPSSHLWEALSRGRVFVCSKPIRGSCRGAELVEP